MTIQQFCRLGLTILLAVPISLMGAFASAAFATGFEVCTDCSTPIGRIFLGFIYVPLALLSAGKIPNDATGARSGIHDIWPLTHSLWGMFLPVALIVLWLLFQRRST